VKSNFERSAAEFDRALILGPNYADSLVEIGWVMGEFFGKGQKGLDLITRAIRLNPNYPDWYEYGLETATYYAGDFKQTIAAFRRVRSHTTETRVYAALSYAQLNDEENAAKQIKELLTLDPEFTARKWLDLTPHPNQGAEALFLEGARKAGLPEG
jgi:tetratricopeptide (TPR) repeat protein